MNVCSLLLPITIVCSTTAMHVFISSNFVVSCSLNSLNSALLSSLFFRIKSYLLYRYSPVIPIVIKPNFYLLLLQLHLFIWWAPVALLQYNTPVSYTHLDVYKRQLLYSLNLSLHQLNNTQ